jgi:hypothetical protein
MYPEYLNLLFTTDSFLTILKKKFPGGSQQSHLRLYYHYFINLFI